MADPTRDPNAAMGADPDDVLAFVVERLEAALDVDRRQLEALQAIRRRLIQHDEQLGQLQEQLLALANRQASSDRVLTSLSNLHP